MFRLNIQFLSLSHPVMALLPVQIPLLCSEYEIKEHTFVPIPVFLSIFALRKLCAKVRIFIELCLPNTYFLYQKQ
jgi:hypothetical protein